MTEEDTRARGAPFPKSPQHVEHRVAVVDVARQMEILESPPHVTRVGGEDDRRPVVEPHPQRLMAGCMTVRRHAHDAAVAEEVVLAVEELDLVTEVVVAAIEGQARGEIGIDARFPLATLHDDTRVRDLRVPAGVVEMEV